MAQEEGPSLDREHVHLSLIVPITFFGIPRDQVMILTLFAVGALAFAFARGWWLLCAYIVLALVGALTFLSRVVCRDNPYATYQLMEMRGQPKHYLAHPTLRSPRK